LPAASSKEDRRRRTGKQLLIHDLKSNWSKQMPENKNKLASWLSQYSKTMDKIEMGLATFSGVVTVLLMALIDANVIGRYTLNMPVPGSVEISIMLLVILLISAQPWVQGKNAHLRLDFIVERVPARAAGIIKLLVLIVSFGFCVVWAWQSAAFASRSWEDAFFGLLVIPIWPALLVIPISIFVICFRIPFQIYEEINKLRGLSGERG
jgi:TRAP-type C4-dicarboxylate transport system permease small subunit